MTVSVLIADDQSVVRAGLKVIVDRDPGLRVVGEAATGAEAVRLAHALRPDVVLMDIRMPELDGIEATRQLVGMRVIVLTTYDSDDHIFAALRAGASGFLLKDTDPAELRRAVHVVAAGEALLAPSVTRRLIAAHTSPAEPAPSKLPGLTQRETEVVALVAGGLSNAEIAEHLVVTVATAKTHINRAMAKLGTRDRAQLVIAAYEHGLVRPSQR